MHKTSQIGYLQILIIILATFLIVAAFIYLKFAPAAEASARLTACKTSVESNALLHIKGIDFSKNIKCPTKELKIKTDDQEQIKTQLADEMVECWDIFKQGKADLFTGEGIFCAVCSRITLETNEPVKGFTEFLYETEAPNTNKKYIEYLSSASEGEMFLKQDKRIQVADTLPPQNQYATMVVYTKGKDYREKFLKMQNTYAAQTGTIVGGSVIAGAGGLISAGIVTASTGGMAVVIGGIVLGAGQAISWFTTTNINEWLAQVFLLPYTEETFNYLGCQDFPVEQAGESET